MNENRLRECKPLPLGDLAKGLRPSLGAALRLLLQPSTLRQWPRVLREGTSPFVLLLIQANNIAMVNRLLNQGKRIVFLSSFPRSGNTWMRFLLTDVLLQAHGVETSTELPVHPDNLIPEFRCDSLLSRFARCPHWARERPTVFVKSHFLFGRLAHMLSLDGPQGFAMQSGGRAPHRDCRILYLYRSPEDALVSVYHLKHDDDYARSRMIHGIDDFCRKHVLRWIDNMTGYFRAADEGVPLFFVSYEQMLAGTALALDETLYWLGMPHDSQMVTRAVSNMQFGKLQAMEAQVNRIRNHDGERGLFFRRGGVGSGCAELKESTVREIRERTASLLCEANRRRMKQSTAHPTPSSAEPIPSETEGPHRNGEARDATVPLRPLGV